MHHTLHVFIYQGKRFVDLKDIPKIDLKSSFNINYAHSHIDVEDYFQHNKFQNDYFEKFVFTSRRTV